jgi:autotransporter-associated beta strand protein
MNATYDNEHDWFSDQIATYLANGLTDPAERQRFESHAANCAACLAELAQARRMETKMSELFAITMPPADFEDRVVSRLRFRLDQRPRVHPLVRKAAVAAAVALLLGGTGYVCQNMLTTGKSPSFSLLDTTPTQIAQKVKGMFRPSSRMVAAPTTQPTVQGNWSDWSPEYVAKHLTYSYQNPAASSEVPESSARREPRAQAEAVRNNLVISNSIKDAAPDSPTLSVVYSDANTHNAGSFGGPTGNFVVSGNDTMVVNSGKLPSESLGVSNGTMDFSQKGLVSNIVTNHGILAPYASPSDGNSDKKTVVVTGPADGLTPVEERVRQINAGTYQHGAGTVQIAQNTSAYTDIGAGTVVHGGSIADGRVATVGDKSMYAFASPGKIIGNSTFTKIGSGTQVIRSSNDYTGGTIIDAGALALNDQRNTFGNNGTAAFRVSQGVLPMTHYTDGTMAQGGASSLVADYSGVTSVNGGTLVASGRSVGTGNNFSNTRELTGTGSNSYGVNTGTMTVNQGNPSAVVNALAPGQVTITNGNLPISITSSAAADPRLTGESRLVAGASQFQNTGSFDMNGFAQTIEELSGTRDSKQQVAAAADSAAVLNATAPGMGRSAAKNFAYTAGGTTWTSPNQWNFGNPTGEARVSEAQARFDPNLFAQSGAGSASNVGGSGTGATGTWAISSNWNTNSSNTDHFFKDGSAVSNQTSGPRSFTTDAPFEGQGMPTTQPTPGFTTHSGTMSLPQPAQSGGALISSAALAQATTRPAGGPAGNANSGAAVTTQEQANAANAAAARRVIREGVMEFEVDSFDSAFNQIATIVGEEGGFIAAADSDKLPNGKVRGTITVRVSPDRLDLLVLKLRALGELKSQKLGSRDIGKEYTDLESDLRASRAMETRLLDIIAKAPGKVNELLEAENKLGEVRTHIEKIMGTLNYYNNLISMATLTVNVAEKDIRTPASADIREEINAGVETEDVETARTAALKAIDDAKGRIVESTLQKLEAGQFAAKIVAEVSPDAAGPIVDRLKQLGRLARYDVQKKQVIENAKPNATVQAQPPVRLETVPTRIIISMYNLANVAPRLTTNLNLAGDDVEAVYRAILKRVTDAGGRIISSNLNKQDAAQVSGTIQYELKSADADAVLNDVRQQALVLRMTVTENPDTANVTTAKQAFTAQIIPTSQLTPKLVSNLNLAAQDVETVYNAVLKRINDSAGARVITSNLNRQDASRISGTIQFEVKSPDADAVLNDIRNQGLVLSLNVTENADGVNVTTTKRGFTATISPIAQLTPKLTTNLSIAAQDVEATYNAILKAVQESEGARVVSSNLNRQDAMQAVGALQIEAKSADAATLLSKIRQNVQVLQMNVIESPAGSNVTSEKQAFTVQVIPTSQVNPRETRVLGIQTSNVEGAVQVVNAAVSGAGGRIIESSMSQDRGGNSVARMVVEVPLDKADIVSDNIRKQGTVRASESSKNTQVPEGPLARARLNLTIATGETIVPTEGGFGNSIREGLSTSVKGLLWSLQLIVIGLCLIGPWVLMVWGGWRIARKRKAAKAQA